MRPFTLGSARAFLAASVLVALSGTGASGDGSTVPAVTLFAAEVGEIREICAMSGTLRPRNEVFVTPRIGGLQIRQVLVDVGDRVIAGDILVRLERGTVEAQYATSIAQVARAVSAIRQAQNQIESTIAELTRSEAELDRARQLRDNGNLSQAAFDDINAGYEAARAAALSAEDGLAIAEADRAQAESQLRIAVLNRSWVDISAPVDGTVEDRNAHLGELTSLSAAPLMTIAENGTIELAAEVIETALGNVAPGDPADVTVAGIGPLIGIVRSVAPTVDETTRLGEVWITLESHPSLRSGLFASGEIVTDVREAVTVPITAVLTGADGAYVQTVTDGVVKAQPVVPGAVWKDRREIVSGLEEGTQVIARAGAFFRDGDRVREVAE